MTLKEKGEAVANSTRDYPTYRNVRYLPLLLLLALLIPLSHATTLPANVYFQNTTSNPAITFPTLAGIPACANTLGGTCQGTDTISGTQTLTGYLYVIGNVIISSGATLITNGYSIFASQTFDSTGATINSGTSTNSTAGAGGTVGSPTGGAGTNAPHSYGGSGGGGGGGNGGSHAGGAGANTNSAGGHGGTSTGGNGATPSLPSFTASNALLWCTNPSYLTGGAGGGGGWGQYGGGQYGGDTGGNGGNSQFGLCIEANSLQLGVITTNGASGADAAAYGGGGGGGGAGTFIGIHGPGLYTAGTYTVTGGGGGNGYSGLIGGSGGSGTANIVTYSTTPPIPIIPYISYPFLIYTTNPALTYTLNSVSNGVQTTLQTGTTLAYVPPSNQPTGTYIFNVTEYNGVSSYNFKMNLSVNMQDLTGSFTYNTPANSLCSTTIQYFPNCVIYPFGTNVFAVKPTSITIGSDVAINQHQNGTGGLYNLLPFSNANLTFTPKVTLCYNVFSPPICFVANGIDNPTVTNTITQMQFQVISSNTVPGFPYTRKILNLVSENEQTLAKINTSTSVALSMLFNNYTISNQTTVVGSNTFGTYIPNSLLQNPSFYISTLTTSSTNGSYFPASNQFCGGFINGTNPIRNLYIYLVSYAVGQGTTVNLQSNYGGANNGDYLQVLSGVNPTYSTAVQQVLISTQNFLIPLIIGNSYSAIIVNSKCQTIYQTPSAAQANPWDINILPTLPPPLTTPQVNATCTLAYNITYAANTITCIGTDNENLVDQWNVSIYNSTGFLGLHLVASNVINGGSFKWQYYPVYPIWGPITWRIVWNWGDPATGSASGLLQNIVVAGFNAPFDVFLTVVFLLVGIVIGNATGGPGGGNTHKLSNTMFIEAFIIFLMYMMGISRWIGLAANASLILFLVVLGLLGSRSEGGVQIGG